MTLFLPDRAPSDQPPLAGLDTADLLAIDRALHDDTIISQLEQQFDPPTLSGVSEITRNNWRSSIDRAHKSSLEGSGVEVVGTRLSLVNTFVPGDATERLEHVAAEPEIPYGEPRPYTPEESEVVLAALRKAAHVPGHRREATLLLAEHSPRMFERFSRRLALTTGKVALKVANPNLHSYQPRHRAKS